MSNRHNVFISYHHANDGYDKNEFEVFAQLAGRDYFLNGSVVLMG